MVFIRYILSYDYGVGKFPATYSWGFKMICSYCDSAVEILALRLGEEMCLDCARSVFYKQLENGNWILAVNQKVGA
jgi:hypothetical protein